MILVLDKKGTHVSHRQGVLLVRQADGDCQRVPLRMLDQVIVHGNPEIEIPVWRALAQFGIMTTILPLRGKGAAAHLGQGLATRLPLRKLQHRIAADRQRELLLAKWFVEQKFNAYDLPLDLIPPDFQPLRLRFIRQRRDALDSLAQAGDIATVMGTEGALANAWFQLLASALPEQWRFTGRNRRPPRDPLNALLSLGYTLLGSELYQILLSEGLDPSLGFLHTDHPARHGLVLDFQEIFRPGIDYFSLGVLADLRPKDFSDNKQEGCRLSKEARGQFYGAWADYRENWPRLSSISEERMRFAPLAEQARGAVMEMRETMKSTITTDEASVDAPA